MANPFTNNGSSTFFNHPQSLELATDVQAHLVANSAARHLGCGARRLRWRDPSILTEGLFLMFPSSKMAPHSRRRTQRHADAIVAGLRDLSYTPWRGGHERNRGLEASSDCRNAGPPGLADGSNRSPDHRAPRRLRSGRAADRCAERVSERFDLRSLRLALRSDRPRGQNAAGEARDGPAVPEFDHRTNPGVPFISAI